MTSKSSVSLFNQKLKEITIISTSEKSVNFKKFKNSWTILSKVQNKEESYCSGGMMKSINIAAVQNL